LVAEFSEKFVLVEVPILVIVGFFDKFQNVIVANVDVQILIENAFNIVEPDQTSLFSVE
jgi:hypothetical protein